MSRRQMPWPWWSVVEVAKKKVSRCKGRRCEVPYFLSYKSHLFSAISHFQKSPHAIVHVWHTGNQLATERSGMVSVLIKQPQSVFFFFFVFFSFLSLSIDLGQMLLTFKFKRQEYIRIHLTHLFSFPLTNCGNLSRGLHPSCDSPTRISNLSLAYKHASIGTHIGGLFNAVLPHRMY